MRLYFLAAAFVATAATAAFAFALAPSAAQTPTETPTPTASATPSPTPTQYPQSLITIRFVRDGQPVFVTLAQALHDVTADGIGCFGVPIPAEVVAIDRFLIRWPLQPAPDERPPCIKEPPTRLRFEFLPYDPVRNILLDVLFAEFVWLGVDITVDIEVPNQSTATATPMPGSGTPVSTPAVQRFPAAGVSDGAAPGWITAHIVAGMALLAISIFAGVSVRRR